MQVKEAIEAARRRSIPIFWVIREHDPSGIDIEWTRKHLVEGDGAGATLPGTKGLRNEFVMVASCIIVIHRL